VKDFYLSWNCVITFLCPDVHQNAVYLGARQQRRSGLVASVGGTVPRELQKAWRLEPAFAYSKNRTRSFGSLGTEFLDEIPPPPLMQTFVFVVLRVGGWRTTGLVLCGPAWLTVRGLTVLPSGECPLVLVFMDLF
jgi:hypothetical protein